MSESIGQTQLHLGKDVLQRASQTMYACAVGERVKCFSGMLPATRPGTCPIHPQTSFQNHTWLVEENLQLAGIPPLHSNRFWPPSGAGAATRSGAAVLVRGRGGACFVRTLDDQAAWFFCRLNSKARVGHLKNWGHTHGWEMWYG